MGFQLRGVLRCGACGKPRGLGTHLCSPGRRKRRRHRLQTTVMWECSTCHKTRGLSHTCAQKSDFKARKRSAATADRKRKKRKTRQRKAARRKQAAAERRARDGARKPGARRSPRPGGNRHEPGSCGDHDCQLYGCKAYWQGMCDCPGPHCSGGCG
jgi:hypothetical protein